MLHRLEDFLQISAIQLDAISMARAHGLDDEVTQRLGFVMTQLASNIIQHAVKGAMILRAVGETGTGCMEVLALDNGPGVTDMTRLMRDSSSSSISTPGDSGFAGIRRMSDLFDIYSQPGTGTAIMVHVGSRNGQGVCSCSTSNMHTCLGVVCLPVQGEDECGDNWAVEITDAGTNALLVDGLGHGPEAAAAARAALVEFDRHSTARPEVVLHLLHTALHNTRGAALSVIATDQDFASARFCGVGNVDGRVVTTDVNRHLVPQNGIVGHTMPRIQPVDIPVPSNARLVMHSDGISPRWSADKYPGLLARHPALLAGVLFRDFARERDDATVLVLREPLSESAH